MQTFRYTIIMSVLMAFICCKSKPQVFDSENINTPSISFGTGGGFTGQVIRYYMSPTGDVFLKTSGETKKIGKLAKRHIDQIYHNYSALGLDALALNQPENKYYFIEYNQKNGPKHSLIWGSESWADPHVKVYYETLMAAVKGLNTKE